MKFKTILNNKMVNNLVNLILIWFKNSNKKLMLLNFNIWFILEMSQIELRLKDFKNNLNWK
jgi:hypothetical protein